MGARRYRRGDLKVITLPFTFELKRKGAVAGAPAGPDEP